MAVIFCHGAHRSPYGRESEALAAAGYDVIAPDYRDLDVSTAADIVAYQILDQERPPILVGHSFGGAVALLAAIRAATRGAATAGVLLCAPALFLAEAVAGSGRLRCPPRVAILHGLRDQHIPVALSRGFAREHDVPLLELDDDHDLSRSSELIRRAVDALSAR